MNAAVPERPLPTPTRESQSFWDGMREGRFMVQHCAGCGKARGAAGATTADLTFRISNRRSAAPDAAEISPQTSLSWPRLDAAKAA